MAASLIAADLSGRHLEHVVEIGDSNGGRSLVRGQLVSVHHRGNGYVRVEVDVAGGQVVELDLLQNHVIADLAVG